MKIIKLTIDNENNIAYLYLDENKKNEIFDTIEMNNMNIDVDKNGMVIGIEFLDAENQFKEHQKFMYQNVKTMPEPKTYELA